MPVAHFPAWLEVLSAVSLSVAVICAVFIALDEVKRPQHMGIMNVVWPVTALFGTVITLWGYFSYGLLATGAGLAWFQRTPSASRQGRPACL